MGGSQKSHSTTKNTEIMNQETSKVLDPSMQRKYESQYDSLSRMYRDKVGQPLNLNFQPGSAGYNSYMQNVNSLGGEFSNRISQPIGLTYAPLYSSTPDAITQNMLSSNVQGINAQQSANQRAAAEQLSQLGTGNNAALLGVLQAQGALGSAGARNQAVADAMKAQRDADVTRQALLAQQNQTKLAERAQSVSELSPGLSLLQLMQSGMTDADKLALAARQQSFGELGAGQDLLNTLNNYINTTAGTKTSGTSYTKQKSGTSSRKGFI